MESKILNAACCDRAAYEKVVAFRSKDSLSDKGNIVLKEIGKFYEADPTATSVDREVLRDRLAREFPKHAEVFQVMVDAFEDVSVPNIIAEVLALKKQALKEKLAAACGATNNDDEIEKIYRELESIRVKENHSGAADLYQGISAAEVVEKTTGGNLIKLWPKEVNDAIGGGVLRKHHIVLFARPDIGKTTFCLNLAYGFLKQGLKVLYLGNEDPAHHIIKRMMCLLAGVPTKILDAQPEKVDAILAKRNWDKFYFAELMPGTPGQIRELVEEIAPDVLIVDQARNLDMKESNKVLQMEKGCKFVRDISKQHDMVGVSVVQAGDSAEGKLVLGMGDVDFSNTGVAATADLMLGFGANDEYERQGQRMISYPKNKINGNKEPTRVPIEFNTFRMG
ncbi:AAA family ATPase [Zhongshania sp.]|uniref:AAA family ATPase n=1 Tax=Zhongshania sp. TaxID=1971902 RepID=UPI0035621B45